MCHPSRLIVASEAASPRLSRHTVLDVKQRCPGTKGRIEQTHWQGRVELVFHPHVDGCTHVTAPKSSRDTAIRRTQDRLSAELGHAAERVGVEGRGGDRQ